MLKNLSRLKKAATPGPWAACGACGGTCQCGHIWSIGADVPVGSAITETELNEIGWHRVTDESRVADMHLIAASPDLAELLLEAEKALSYVSRMDANGWVRQRCAPVVKRLKEFDETLYEGRKEE